MKLFTALVVTAFAGMVSSQNPGESHLLLCSDAYLRGRGITFTYTPEECVEMPTDFNDQVSSAAPEGDGHKCTLYRDYGCRGPSFTFEKYVDFLDTFNDRTSSFRCDF